MRRMKERIKLIGLNPDFTRGTDDGFLEHCHGFRSNGTRLSGVPATLMDVEIASASFPYPQLIRTSDVTLLFTATKIYEYKNPRNAEDLKLVYEVASSGDGWTCADFGSYLILSNGIHVVIRDPDSKTYAEKDDSSMVIPYAEAFAEFNGQVIAGGVQNNFKPELIDSIYVPNFIHAELSGLTEEIVTLRQEMASTVEEFEYDAPETPIVLRPLVPQGQTQTFEVIRGFGYVDNAMNDLWNNEAKNASDTVYFMPTINSDLIKFYVNQGVIIGSQTGYGDTANTAYGIVSAVNENIHITLSEAVTPNSTINAVWLGTAIKPIMPPVETSIKITINETTLDISDLITHNGLSDLKAALNAIGLECSTSADVIKLLNLYKYSADGTKLYFILVGFRTYGTNIGAYSSHTDSYMTTPTILTFTNSGHCMVTGLIEYDVANEEWTGFDGGNFTLHQMLYTDYFWGNGMWAASRAIPQFPFNIFYDELSNKVFILIYGAPITVSYYTWIGFQYVQSIYRGTVVYNTKTGVPYEDGSLRYKNGDNFIYTSMLMFQNRFYGLIKQYNLAGQVYGVKLAIGPPGEYFSSANCKYFDLPSEFTATSIDVANDLPKIQVVNGGLYLCGLMKSATATKAFYHIHFDGTTPTYTYWALDYDFRRVIMVTAYTADLSKMRPVFAYAESTKYPNTSGSTVRTFLITGFSDTKVVPFTGSLSYLPLALSGIFKNAPDVEQLDSTKYAQSSIIYANNGFPLKVDPSPSTLTILRFVLT